MYTPECDHAFILYVFLLYQPFLSFSCFHVCVCESVHARMCDDQTTLWERVLTFHLAIEGPLLQALRRSKPVVLKTILDLLPPEL